MRRRRFPIRLPLLLTILALCAVIALYVVGLAWWQSRDSSRFAAQDLYVPRLIDVVIAFWLFWVGSSVGSFLNVVAWRMPLGIGVNGRSHCPRCKTQLSMRDNFPVFGWLALGGRCRTCKLPISPRYPIVEACVGLSLTVVSIAELYRVALPHHAVPHGGPLWAPRIESSVLWTLLYHAVAVAFCWSFGLIRIDGKRLPVRMVTLGLLAAMVPMLVFPQLMIVTWQMARPPGWTPDRLYLDAVMRVLTALVAAGVFARTLARSLCPAADPKLNPLGGDTYRLLDLVAIIALPTIIVGWQASPCLVLLASVLAVAGRPILPDSCDALGRFAIAMPIAMTLQIACWRRLNDSAWWTGEGSSTAMLLVAAAFVLCVPLWLNDRGKQPDHPVTNSGDNGPGRESASQEDEI
jgi:leader peptidase (prepilin peptidase)/N-methyltransferase